MIGKTRWVILLAVAGMAMCVSLANAGIVNYGGTVGWDEYGSPVQYGYVIVGTFDDSFDPLDFVQTYSEDQGNGTFTIRYSEAVSDGVWAPIAPGTMTGKDGRYLGVGSSSGSQAGKQIYMMCFDTPTTTGATRFALCTSTNPDWVASSASNVLYGRDADVVVQGGKSGHFDVDLQSVMAVPEPSTIVALLSMLGVGGVWAVRRRVA